MDGAIPRVTLNSGRTMPVIGLGTATVDLPVPAADRLISAFVDAVEVGYRHFDTAALYGTEQPLGLAVAEAVRRGLIGSRDELFITSKLWCTDADRDLVLPALKKSLSNLGLDYLDLYLVHWPVRAQHGEITIPIDKEDFLPFDTRSVWEAMEECHRLGLVRSIGVSNFTCKKLSELLADANIPPAVNQVEMNPTWDQSKLRAFCKDHGVHVTAWSPLGGNGAPWGSLAVVQSQVLTEIARAKGKTLAQVSLRWLYEQGVSMVVKSFNKGRMKENLQIFDWELSEEDRRMIGKMTQRRGYRGDDFVSPNGPYKSPEELWDGEM